MTESRKSDISKDSESSNVNELTQHVGYETYMCNLIFIICTLVCSVVQLTCTFTQLSSISTSVRQSCQVRPTASHDPPDNASFWHWSTNQI